MRTGRGVLATGLCSVVALAGCGGSEVPGAAASPGAGAVRGSLTVFAAASLTEALTDDRVALAADNPGLDIAISFAGSQQLVAQVQAGAPADVVATADEAGMRKLVDANLVEAPRIFARNALEIAVGPGNPKAVRGLADLARTDLRVVLAAPTVPVGKYGRQALDRARVTVNPVSLELDVKSEMQKVEAGEADAALVYATDVRAAGPRAAGVAIPGDQNVLATYPVAVVRMASNARLARWYVDQLVGGRGRQALRRRGFLDP